MNRREFLKRMAGATLGAAAIGVSLPNKAKGKIITPITGMFGDAYLDNRIESGLKAVKAKQPGLKLGELHCHSIYSDGNYEVSDILYRAAALGLDFVVMTEHLTPYFYPMENVIRSIEARQQCLSSWCLETPSPIEAYPAFEISTQQGHLILLFPNDYLSGSYLRDLDQRFRPYEESMPTMETAARWVRAMGGVSIVPHPNIERAYPFGAPVPFIKRHLTGLVDGIEDISSAHGYNENYSEELGLASIGSSDDHFNFLIGSTVTGYDSGQHPDLLSAIKARATQAISIDNSLEPLIATARIVF